MKNLSLHLILCLVTIGLYGQAPFILKGKLDNCPEDLLFIAIENWPGLPEIDTIKIEADGSFFYENKEITRPHQTSIQRNNVQFNDIYIAPGYQLTLTANVVTYDSLVATRKISGIGAVFNSYQFFLESTAMQDTTQWARLATPELLDYAQSKFEQRERIHERMLSDALGDPYWDHFKTVAKLNNEAFRAYYLLEHINLGNSYGQNLDDTVAEFLGVDFAIILSDEKYLDSKVFLDGILLNAYLKYQINKDYEKEPALREDPYYSLRKILSLYNGKIRDCALLSVLIRHVYGSHSIEMLNDRLSELQAFLAEVQEPAYLAAFNQKLERHMARLP